MAGLPWEGHEYLIATILHEQDWSNNQIGRLIHRSRQSVYHILKGQTKQPTITKEDVERANMLFKELGINAQRDNITTKHGEDVGVLVEETNMPYGTNTSNNFPKDGDEIKIGGDLNAKRMFRGNNPRRMGRNREHERVV